MKRDEAWLQSLLDTIWDSYFPDVQQVNDVKIQYGRRAKRRLGSISLDPHDRSVSIITINPLFQRSDVPQFVVEATIFHELTHYAHGFNSPLAQAQVHPHAGGVMKREYSDRGMLELYLTQKRWLKFHWQRIVAEEFQPKRRSTVTNVQATSAFMPLTFWKKG